MPDWKLGDLYRNGIYIQVVAFRLNLSRQAWENYKSISLQGLGGDARQAKQTQRATR